jgi:hypothetical protein
MADPRKDRSLGIRWAVCLTPDVLSAFAIARPETVIRWHRAGFPCMGAPRIHGELLKLGIEVGQKTVAK